MARANVKTSTRDALLLTRILAHSFTVAPVVKTSSTRRIFLFFIFSGLRTMKAFLTFRRLSVPLRPVWGWVQECLSSTRGSILSLQAGNIFLQSMRAWLKPLWRKRFVWRGTGTSKSGCASGCFCRYCWDRAAKVARPCILPLYLNILTASDTGGWYWTTARACLKCQAYLRQ